MTNHSPSADHLRKMLAADPGPLKIFMTDAIYHAQVECTCQLLAVVDEVADAETADRITAAILDRLTGPAAAEAAERAQQHIADVAALMRTPG